MIISTCNNGVKIKVLSKHVIGAYKNCTAFTFSKFFPLVSYAYWAHINPQVLNESKKGGRDQKSIQSSTTPDSG